MADENNNSEIADCILDVYASILSMSPDQINQLGVTIPIPTFNESSVTSIVNKARDIFMTQETLIDVPLPVYVVGDLHGNIFDLVRILIMSGPPPKNRFLFLGDYVDRGQYSVEIITLLFAMLVKYPNYIYLIRGNHEFSRVNEVYGLKGEVMSLYESSSLFDIINKCFNYMPLVALISNSIFCVHGGISQQISSMKQLKKIKRPIPDYVNNIASELTWNDPSTEITDFSKGNARGNCVTFGADAVQSFLKSFRLKHIFRAHQVVQLGVEKFAGDGLYTIFSSSNYQESQNNRCGLLLVKEDGEIQSFSLPPIIQIPREKALTKGETLPGKFVPSERRSSLVLDQYSDDDSYIKHASDDGTNSLNSPTKKSMLCLRTPVVNTPFNRTSYIRKRTTFSFVGINRQNPGKAQAPPSKPVTSLPTLKEQ